MSKEYFVYDLETRSECDLKKCGAAEYARHPTTTIFCVSWAMGTKEALKDAPVHSWSPVFGGPKHVLHGMLLNKDVTLVAHNAGFEASVTRHVLSRLLNDARLRELPPERFLCTASLASSLALPRSLEGACSAYGLGEKKDVEGRKLILKYTKPRRPTANNPEKWHNKIDELKRIIEYCENDVRAEVELFLKAYPLSDFERQLWILDQKINERGFTVDRELVGAALELIEIEKDRIEKETVRISKGEIPSTTQRDKTLLWLEANGVELPNLQAKTIRDFLAIGEGPEHCLDILRLRQAASKTSTAKYEAFEARSRSDGRSRDNLIFHGATTGRWCLPSDAEVLTPRGWVASPINGENIMQWDSQKDHFKFGPIRGVNRFSLKDSDVFLQAKNRNTTMLVTSEHRLPTYSSRGVFKTETAIERYGKATDVPISSFYSGNFLAELESRVLVMVQADGHYTTNPKKGLYLRLKFRKIRKIKRCRNFLEKLGVKFRENNFKDGVRFDISVKDLPDFLKQFKDKTFNFKTHNFDPAVFVDELPFWDGHKQKGLESFEYSTCNYDNAFFAQTMAHLCGYSARVVSRNREPSRWRVNYRVFIRKTRRVCFRKKDWKKRKAYGKTAWCPVTDTGFFLCRYRDSIFITGNSGSGVQIQNLPKSKTKDTDQLAEILKSKDLEMLRLLYGDPMSAISDALRSCIIASPGKELFVVDYASIEVRVLFWLAGHEEGLKALREGKDLYVEMASQIYKKKSDDISKDERALGKAAILGCIAEGTKVLTDSGFKKIESIKIEDKIWDGKHFVNHQGLLAKGPKSVINIPSLGIELTPDHWVLRQNVWRTAGEIALIEATRLQSLGREMETSSSLKVNFIEGPSAVSVSAACAELRKNYESINFSEVLTYCVTNAPNPSTVKEAETLLTKPRILFLVQNLERVGTLVSLILKKDVTGLVTRNTHGTAVAALDAPLNPLEIFWNTLLHSTGLISGGSRWTELITTEIMSEEILESFLNPKTIKTELRETYDIHHCGQERRFQAGNAIVHNCGYSMSANKFFETCKMFGMDVTEELAKLAVDTYRKVHAPVVELWKKTSQTSIAAVQNKREYKCGKVKWGVRDNFLYAELPSGRRLSYYKPSLRNELTPWNEMRPVLYSWATNGLTRKFEEYKNYGGMQVENLSQAVSRDLIADAMIKIENAGFEVLLSVHDELIAERKIGESTLKEFENIMLDTPAWAEGLPIAVEGFKSARYRK